MFKPIKPLTFIKYRTKTRYVADIIRSYDFYQKDAEYRRNQCENYYKVDMDLMRKLVYLRKWKIIYKRFKMCKKKKYILMLMIQFLNYINC